MNVSIKDVWLPVEFEGDKHLVTGVPTLAHAYLEPTEGNSERQYVARFSTSASRPKRGFMRYFKTNAKITFELSFTYRLDIKVGTMSTANASVKYLSTTLNNRPVIKAVKPELIDAFNRSGQHAGYTLSATRTNYPSKRNDQSARTP